MLSGAFFPTNYDTLNIKAEFAVKDINNIWCRVFQIKSSIKLKEKKRKIYNLIAKDNQLIIRNKLNNEYKFRDFIESQDEKANNKIDKLVESRLNILSKKILNFKNIF